jgi:quinoprotein relay system zinc metallohydrolase 2
MIGNALSHTALRWILAAAFFIASSTIGAATQSFNLREIAPGVFVHLGKQLALDVPGHDDIANIGFVVGTRCVAIIDTGGSVRVGRALRTAVKTKTSLPICYVINTHVHVDHVLGNFAFKDDKPSFIGHQALPAAIASNRDFFLKNYSADLDSPVSAEQIIAPDRSVTIGNDVTLDLGGRDLTLRAWPKAHTDCDLSVHDEKTGTLWSGDLLFRERLPALDGSVTGWLAALDELARTRVRLIVPGHGGTANNLAIALDPERRYLQSLIDGVRAAIAQGKPMEVAIEQVDKGKQSGWLLWDQTHPHNVARAYQELEWE